MALLRISNGYGPGIKLGCDPEFLLVRGGSTIYVGRTWSGKEGNFGCDGGSSYLGELRPSPGTPAEVVSNMRTLISKVREIYPDTMMVCGGGANYSKCVGGHIHFNIKAPGNFGVPPEPFGGVLDRYLGRPLKAMTGGKRATTGYGSQSDFRWQEHGFEYRTPPSWISDPLLAEAVLSVAYRLAEMGRSKVGFTKKMSSSSGIPTAKEYLALVPKGNAELKVQVDRFCDYVLGGFDLSTDDCFERWLSPVPYEFRPGCMVNLRNAKVATVVTPPQPVSARTFPKPHATHLINVKMLDHDQEIGSCQVHSPERGMGIMIHKGDYYNTDIVIGRVRDGKGITIDYDAVYVDHRLKPLFRRPRGGKYKFVRFGNGDMPNYMIWTSDESDVTQDNIIDNFLSRPKRRSRSFSEAARERAEAVA